MYILNHTKIVALIHFYMKNKGTYNTWKEPPLPSQHAHKYYIIIVTVLQFLMHYFHDVDLKLFSFDFFKFPATFVGVPPMTCELHYIVELYAMCSVL